MAERVAIFGGSFNPPHVAHVLAIAWVLATEDLDRLVVVPTFQHPFAKPLERYDDRVKMCELAVAWIPRVSVSRVEEELGGESRTIRTLEHLATEHPDWSMRLVMGADLVLEVDKWFRFDRIRELAPPLVLGRAGFHGPGVPEVVLPAVSSSAVRARIERGKWEELRALVPRVVLEHIRAHRLYQHHASE